MEIKVYLEMLLQAVLIPLLGILTKFIVELIRTKSAEIFERSQSDTTRKYIRMIEETVVRCVKTTNQVYVDAIKQKNEAGKNVFTAEEQREAFEMTYNAVLFSLAEDAQDFLKESFQDSEEFLRNLIESAVRDLKTGGN